MKMVADLYLTTSHFSCSILNRKKASTVIHGVGKNRQCLKKNARDLITLLLDTEPDFSIDECHITPPSLRKAPNHRCIKGRCASFFPLQRCGSVCGVIVSIFSVIISKNPGLFISLCKANSANSNHQLALFKGCIGL